jgi:hypothetical protein
MIEEVHWDGENNVTDGLTTRWTEDGLLKSKETRKQGLLLGPRTTFHANGEKYKESIETKGGSAQPTTWWHKNGQKMAEGKIDINQGFNPCGEWKCYSNTGRARACLTMPPACVNADLKTGCVPLLCMYEADLKRRKDIMKYCKERYWGRETKVGMVFDFKCTP